MASTVFKNKWFFFLQFYLVILHSFLHDNRTKKKSQNEVFNGQLNIPVKVKNLQDPKFVKQEMLCFV